MSLVIQLRDNQTAFAPNERISGQVSWQLETAPKSAELRLVWGTSGRGNRDFSVVETIPFPNPQAAESRPFTFTAPNGPYSFSGKLITLTWGVEFAIEPGNELVGQEIIIAPEGRAITLPESARK